MSRAFEQLQVIVGPAGMVGPEAAADMLVDERRLYQGRALAVVAPADTAQLAAVVRCCHDNGWPMVPQGGNTGYCGGATPSAAGNEVLISLARLRGQRGIDRTGLTLTVEAGCTLAEVQAMAAAEGLLFPLAMGSQASCQIGGNIATNAGGLAVLRYGTARELVLGLEVVLADGSVLSDLEGLRKNNTGYPLAQLFCGAEGTLGIISAATLRLFPAARAQHTLWLALADLNGIDALLLAFRAASGDCVTSFEYVSRASLEYVTADFGYADPLAAPAAHYALVELSTSGDGDALATVMESQLAEAIESGLVLDGVLATSERQRRELWQLREHIPAAERHMGGSIKHDVAVVPSRLPAFTAALRERMAAAFPDLRLSVYGHVGDGNLHFNVLAPAGVEDPQFVRRDGPAVSRLVHDCTAEYGGSFSAEHGIGKYKSSDLARYADPVRLALMRSVKQALDPRGLMNPGKLFDDEPGADQPLSGPGPA